MAVFSKKLIDNQVWPTTMKGLTKDGRAIGVDKSVWVYRAVPLAPVIDARSPEEGLATGDPIQDVLEELSAITHLRGLLRRQTSKNNYREVHTLLVNIPWRYTPPVDSPLYSYLSTAFNNVDTDRRLLVMGVKLRSNIGAKSVGGPLETAIASVSSLAESVITGATPMSDYDRDYAEIDAIMSRNGLLSLSPSDYSLLNGWWNYGQAPDTPMLTHLDHLHIFRSSDSLRAAAVIMKEDSELKCEEWGLDSGHHTITFGCVREFDLEYVNPTTNAARWGAALVDRGALCVSIHGKVEPPNVTRGELRRRKKNYIDDINERSNQNKMERQEQTELLQNLDEMEGIYATGGPATLMDGAIMIAVGGYDKRTGYDISDFGQGTSVVIDTMTDRQDSAIMETMLCSPIRAVPHLHDIPSHALAASGLTAQSMVGDQSGALLGFTERDHQPGYISPTAAADEDSLPIFVTVGQSGSGKSVTMLYLADQLARITTAYGEKTPVVIIDPKSSSSHDAAVQMSGGKVHSLDDLIHSDGVFDPMRFSSTINVGVELSSTMLLSINPWGTMKEDYETPLIKALAYGAGQGADCIGEALQIALDDGQAPHEMVTKVFDLAGGSPMFRACVGMKHGGTSLRTSEGITLIKVGEGVLDLPEPGDIHVATQQQRIALALVRMMVFGSAAALSMRSGVLMLDEAWVMLSAGRSEMNRLGRLARSQQILPMLFTQRISDALDAGLAGYISRGLILPIQDREEAEAACELFRLEATPERMERITAKAYVGGNTETSTAPNWNSMRALRDKDGKVVRGAIGIYVDLAGRAVPVEIKLPKDFLERASTNPEDIRRRAALAKVQ
jgi:hypothetical protein